MKAQRKLVSFIGLGCKNASSLLYSYIKLHPAVFTLEEETEFFSNTKMYAQGINWYESQFLEGEGLVCGELASSYLKNSTAVSLIARTYPSAKLIAVIENPLVSVRVAYVEARRSRAISRETSLAMFLKQNPEVLTEAKYGRQLAQYFNYYSHKDLFVVTADDVREETLAVLAKAYEHLEVDNKFIPLILQHLVPTDESLVIKRPGLIKRGYRSIKKAIASAYRAIVTKIHPVAIPVETASDLAKRMPLSPELEEYLRNYYRNDVIVLSNALHRNMSVEWGFEAEG